MLAGRAGDEHGQRLGDPHGTTPAAMFCTLRSSTTWAGPIGAFELALDELIDACLDALVGAVRSGALDEARWADAAGLARSSCPGSA